VLLLGVIAAGTTTACGDPPGHARSPEAAATGFLEAVAHGRADDALAYLRVQPTDRRLLTDDVLADAAQPITAITAQRHADGSDRHHTIDVSYQIGGKPVTDTYSLVRLGSSWFIDETLPTVPQVDEWPEFADMTVGGQKVSPGVYYYDDGTPLFPGRYQLGVDHPLLVVDNAELTVPSLHQPVVLTADGPHVRLTDAGQEAVATAAQEMLTTCLAATTPAVACLRFSSSEDVDDDQVQWSLDPGGTTDLTTTAPAWRQCGSYGQYYGPVCAEGLFVLIRRTAHTTHGGTWVRVYSLMGYMADIRDPDHIRIAFSQD